MDAFGQARLPGHKKFGRRSVTSDAETSLNRGAVDRNGDLELDITCHNLRYLRRASEIDGRRPRSRNPKRDKLDRRRRFAGRFVGPASTVSHRSDAKL